MTRGCSGGIRSARRPRRAGTADRTYHYLLGIEQNAKPCFLPFEVGFGRHIAIFHPALEIAALKERLQSAGAHLMQPVRPSLHERFFFREPVNGYVFEVIAQT